MSQPDGDQCAFGHAAENGHCPGITKREWFAGMALQGYVTGMVTTGGRPALKADTVSLDCFILADAMLRQREPS